MSEELDIPSDPEQTRVGASFLPTTEPWAPYYRYLWPDYASPRSGYIAWGYGTTGVSMAQAMWNARERTREQWEIDFGHDPAEWDVGHPPVVLWIPNVAHAACLRCLWIDRGSDSTPWSAGNRARGHSVDRGSNPDVVRHLRVPVSERKGPIDDPLPSKWV